MSLKDRTITKSRPTCSKCQHSPLFRTIHLLRLKDMGYDDSRLKFHLEREFPHWEKPDIDSELNWCGAIGRLWGQRAIENKVPLWMAWLEGHGFTISRTGTGWRIWKGPFA